MIGTPDESIEREAPASGDAALAHILAPQFPNPF